VLVVGVPPDRLEANSTILAIGSDYFKALLFGPMRAKHPDDGQKREVILPDVTPGAAAAVLAYLHDNLRYEEDDEDLLWQTRVAADQFLLKELVSDCEKRLIERLSHKSAIGFLKRATEQRAEHLRLKAFSCIKNRRRRVLCPPENVVGLNVFDLAEVARLFHGQSCDEVVDAIIAWGKALGDGEMFKREFGTHLKKAVNWGNVSEAALMRLNDENLVNFEQWHQITTQKFGMNAENRTLVMLVSVQATTAHAMRGRSRARSPAKLLSAAQDSSFPAIKAARTSAECS